MCGGEWLGGEVSGWVERVSRWGVSGGLGGGGEWAELGVDVGVRVSRWE